MTFGLFMGIVCVTFLLLSLFFLLFAMASFYYPQSRTTVEVYPTDVQPPRRWMPIFVQSGISFLAAVLAIGLFNFTLMPGISDKARADQLAEAEEITRDTFKQKLGQEPQKMNFDDDPRTSLEQLLKWGWELKGTAWLDNGQEWDVKVARNGIRLTCEAAPRR